MKTIVKNEKGLDITVGETYITPLGSKIEVIYTNFNGSEIVGILKFKEQRDSLCTRTLHETIGWVKYDPLYDLKVDDKVFVRNFEYDQWCPRYFAEVKNGKIAVFILGKTSFTNNGANTCTFNCWKKAD